MPKSKEALSFVKTIKRSKKISLQSCFNGAQKDCGKYCGVYFPQTIILYVYIYDHALFIIYSIVKKSQCKSMLFYILDLHAFTHKNAILQYMLQT